MVKALWVFVYCALVVPFASAANMSLSQALIQYVERSPELQSVRHEWESSEQRVNRAWAALFPSLNLDYIFNYSEIPDFQTRGFGENVDLGFLATETQTWRLTMNQTIFRGGSIYYGIRQARAQRDQKLWQYRQKKQDLIKEFIDQALSLDQLHSTLKVLEESYQTQKRFVALTRLRRRKGIARDFELSQALAEEYSYEPRINGFQQQKEALSRQLSTSLGLDPTGELQVQYDRELPKFIKVPAKPVEQALQHRPDYIALTISEKVARFQKWIDMSEHFPEIKLSASKFYQDSDARRLYEDLNESLSVTLSIPIFSGLSSLYQDRETTFNVMTVEKQRRRTLEQITAQVEQAQLGIQLGRDRWLQSSKWASVAEQALQQGLRSFRVGVVSNSQIVQLQSSRERASLDLIESLKSYRLNVLEWEHALGKDLEKIYGIPKK